MATRRRLTLPVLKPALQVSFHYRLQAIRDLYLHEALKSAVDASDLASIDRELASLVRVQSLKNVAKCGLRGEVFFAVPCLLSVKPSLLGYYRLLLGYSQKEFYSKGPFGRFKRLEESGELSPASRGELPALCRSLIGAAEMLVEGIDRLSLDTVHDLQLLTLGPQLRGGENTRLGQAATQEVFALLKDIVAPYLKEATNRMLVLQNASRRTVVIEFASDPDVRISEQLPSGVRPCVSIEVKGGTDYSNVHNRLGEAEKSHQKARARGFFEFWTILRVKVDPIQAKRESPTTSHFFHLDEIRSNRTAAARQFREMLCSIMGIRNR
jgi:hypothetical protein